MTESRTRGWLTDPVPRKARRSDTKVSLATRADLLAKVPMFEGLSKRQLQAVATEARGSRWPEGARVVVEGAHESSLSIIVDGELEVLRGDARVARLGPGDFFGEVALLDPGPRTATLRTLSDVVTVDLTREAFLRVVATEPKALLRMLQTMARRSRAPGTA